jgi:hypothetical protein
MANVFLSYSSYSHFLRTKNHCTSCCHDDNDSGDDDEWKIIQSVKTDIKLLLSLRLITPEQIEFFFSLFCDFSFDPRLMRWDGQFPIENYFFTASNLRHPSLGWDG